MTRQAPVAVVSIRPVLHIPRLIGTLGLFSTEQTRNCELIGCKIADTMDAASNHATSPDPRPTAGSPRRKIPTPVQEQDQRKSPETKSRQGPGNGADQLPKADSVPITVNGNEILTSEEEPNSSAKSKFMVKLKYRTKIAVTSPQDHENVSNASSTSPDLRATPDESAKPSIKTAIVKQEVQDYEATAPRSPNSTSSQVKIEKQSDDQDPALKPLNEPTGSSGQVIVVKDEPEHDVQRSVNDRSQDLTSDAVSIDGQPGDEAIQISIEHDTSGKSSDAVGFQAATSEPENLEASAIAEVQGVDDVNGGYQQSANGPSIARDNDLSFVADTNMSYPFDVDEWASNAANQAEADAASGARQHQHYQPIDHQAMSSDFTYGTTRMRPEDPIDQESLAFLSGEAEAGVPWSQRQHVFTDPVRFTKSSSPSIGSARALNPAAILRGIPQYATHSPRYGSQQPAGQNRQLALDSAFNRQQELQALVEEKQRQLDQVKKKAERQRSSRQVSYDSASYHGQPAAVPSFLTGPMSYQRASPSGYQQMNYGQDSSHNWTPERRTTQVTQKIRKQLFNEHDCDDEEGNASDDDEPLRTRVERHPSVTSLHDDSSVEFVASNSKPKSSGPIVDRKVVRMPRPLPQPASPSPTPTENAPPSSDDIQQIDWTLPRYEMQRQPLEKGEEIPSAKVSLPGMVREEVLLSPDHADEEARLLIDVFIPGQQAMSSPDPEPAVALLNFHTITLMVIEAYVQFEIGDEFGMGRGHFHQDHNRGEEDYERMRDAVNADTNEIFFAVVDRYRAGLESKKKPLQLIRGTQEFCDVALDVIYYIKQHGLLKPEPKAKKVRADKGTKRGPQAKTAAAEAAAVKGKGKGTKRGTAARPNEVQPRKRVKTAPAVEVKKKKRSKPEPALTVVRK
ncbi:hypothetical protein J4E85_009633 [Alternaria conjuncta]|uniref:uncharacterized protein n=1 Tax=Alternaria conjuncta TaxID=181017 RepID=UPI00221EBAA6|nr:uncharacterized protein J4E85_009633 [Alternaria conjuncta]KAI4918845.1 hypothetical protein J4E85_009633 [Alternaria conjuncta]